MVFVSPGDGTLVHAGWLPECDFFVAFVSPGDGDYRLVVVCTTENEYRARIVAALDKFRRPSPSLSNTSMVRSYLRSRFAAPLHKAGTPSAAALDPER